MNPIAKNLARATAVVCAAIAVLAEPAVARAQSGDTIAAVAADTARDDAATAQRAGALTRFAQSRFCQMTHIGVPLIAGGLAVRHNDRRFRSLRNEYMPSFSRHFDDYLQFSPGAVMLGLKVAGVPSRSSWGRMTASCAMSAAIMGSVVNTVKHSAKVMRPDGSNSHSFPSGHTATAFMAATMLSKEYGHLSPWVSIGAYSAATATGLMRVANNKHWLSDVLTGAGIGILSTELGYFIADLVFKNRGITRYADDSRFSTADKPSFAGLYVGFNVPLSRYDIDEATTFRISSGSTAGVEGAWFFNRHFGVGGLVTVMGNTIVVNGTSAESASFDAVTVGLGGYYSCPLSPRWLVGCKALGLFVRYPRMTLSTATVPETRGVGLCSGVSVTFRAHRNYGMRLFADYSLLPSHSRQSGESINMLVLGSAFTVMF